tara:strand:- start:1625 stop:2161 length:537 start_codon:yes stop_codon:yes gene_type:complete
MGNSLRFLKQVSFSDVTAGDVTDVFSSDFDIYKIVSTGYDETSGDANRANIRFINSSGSIDSSSSYDHASLAIEAAASGAYPTVKSSSADHINFVLYDNGQSGASSSGQIYVFNPFNSSSYTFVTFSESHFQQGYGASTEKGVGTYKVQSSLTGFRLYSSASGNFNVRINVYGIRIDS